MTEIHSAAQAAAALRPVAGEFSGLLFIVGVVGVGFLAVPIMTTGAAYDLVQTFAGHGSLHDDPGEARVFYGVIATVTLGAVAINSLGLNPMKMLVWSGIVQGFTVPPLLVVMMIMTNDRKMMSGRVNSLGTNLLGAATILTTVVAGGFLVVSWLS